MHAYLLISQKDTSIKDELKKRQILDGFKPLEFPLRIIDDARALSSFIKLSISEKTAIIINNFQDATEECVNAILKNIEEPQENVAFVIHSTNENLILPTIRSRCQIIHINSASDTSDFSETRDFFKMDPAEKAEILSKNKKREGAIKFSEKLIKYLMSEIATGHEIKQSSKLVKAATTLNKSLKLNGNVNLQILRFLSHITD